MILGLGLDVVEVSRIARSWEKFGERFAHKVLHPLEQERAGRAGAAAAQFLASRFAAKEAAVKALGTGFSQGIRPVDICVESMPGGRPVLRLFGKAEERLREMGVVRAHLSLTHGKETVAAVVILEDGQ
ncbi:MAG: holo-ACP synthase [Deltaproteobacteria bacterium]|jgi:holo-[acyl-carrier protein] synthase|nr:holo-ACP synthase [Deltaproteobacteria bacterium]